MVTTNSTTAEITSRIAYNRGNRDFDCYVTIDGDEQYIGSARNYSEGESKCNAYAYDHYSDTHTPEVAAAIALGDVVVVARCATCGGEGDCPDCGTLITLCEVCGDPADWQVRENGGFYTFVCDTHYQQEFNANEARDTSWEAEPMRPIPAAALLAEVDALLSDGPRCPGTGLADCGERLPAGALFCASCTQIHHRIRWAAQFPNDQERWIAAGREWEQRSARILANVAAMLAPTCKNCGAGHSIQTCPEIRALLFAPVVRRVVAHDASV